VHALAVRLRIAELQLDTELKDLHRVVLAAHQVLGSLQQEHHIARSFAGLKLREFVSLRVLTVAHRRAGESHILPIGHPDEECLFGAQKY
jgi:hypothetical protein